MRQRAIRFPDDLHDAIEAEAKRLGPPWTFSSVIVNAARRAVGRCDGLAPYHPAGECGACDETRADERIDAQITSRLRGSPSPSLERFGGKQ